MKVKRFIAVLMAIIVMFASETVNVYAEDNSESFEEAIEKLNSKTLGKTVYDADEYYNALREYYTVWSDEIVDYIVSANKIRDEEEIANIKTMNSWDESNPNSQAGMWTAVYIQLYNVNDDVDITFKLVYDADAPDAVVESKRVMYGTDPYEIYFKTTVKKDDDFKKVIFLNPFGLSGFKVDSLSVDTPVTEVKLDGNKTTLNNALIRNRGEEWANYTLQIAFGDSAKPIEQLEEISFADMTEIAKENGTIKEVVFPVKSYDSKNDSFSPSIIWGIAAGVFIVAAIGIIMVVRKKRL